MSRRLRLDAELVRRGLARSRDQAADLIAAGRVAVAGQVAAKPASQVAVDAAITVEQASEGPDYVSRGGHKLAGALAVFASMGAESVAGEAHRSGTHELGAESVAGQAHRSGTHELGAESVAGRAYLSGTYRLVVAGKRCLDAGASTGGFTDVLLRAGAAHVLAVDVGYGQLAWSLQRDERVTVLDRVNVRNLTPEQVAPPPDLVVADLSFISLTVVLPALAACAAANADFLLMVKPQFEVGKDKAGSGVVRDPELRAAAVAKVASAAADVGLGVAGITASPLPGPSGNVEYFLWLRRGAGPLDEAALREAIAAGPQ
jgi:23S rRNA (cytidine1920-2'-O)/16S rRNA (cytidine1409-2'-O)-methyltransferase